MSYNNKVSALTKLSTINDIENISDIEAYKYTYAELKNIKNTNHLEPGKLYILSDYKTIYYQPYSKVIKTATTTEQLVLRASSDKTFYKECASIEYPDDIIYYDFDNDVTEDSSATARNGYITRRWNLTNNINVPGDWRTQKWVRFRIDTSEMTSYNFTETDAYKDTNGSIVKGKYYLGQNYSSENISGNDIIVLGLRSGSPYYYKTQLGPDEGGPLTGYEARPLASDHLDRYFVSICAATDYFLAKDTQGLAHDENNTKEYYTFDLNGAEASQYCYNIYIGEPPTPGKDASLLGNHNNVFRFNVYTGAPHDINAGDAFVNNSIGNKCYYSTFEQGFMNNYLASDCGHQNIGPNCYNNIFGKYSGLNNLGPKCYNNIFGARCHSLNLNTNCYGNRFGDQCYSNVMETYCHDNYICYDSHGNTFGPYNYSNVLGHFCSDNMFQSKCNGNLFNSSLNNVTLSSNIRNVNFENPTSLDSGTSSADIIKMIYNRDDKDNFPNCLIVRTAAYSSYSNVFTLYSTNDMGFVRKVISLH